MSFRLDLPPFFRDLNDVFTYMTKTANRLNYALGFLDVPEATASAAFMTEPEDLNNKSIRIDENSTNTQYPTARAVYNYAVPHTRKVNGKPLSDDVTMTPEDLGEGDFVQSIHAGGIWTWRKWASGRADCIGELTFQIPAGGMTAAGAVWRYDKQTDFPADLFIVAPRQKVSAGGGDIQFIVGSGGSAISKTTAAFSVFAVEEQINAATVRVVISADGRWKE